MSEKVNKAEVEVLIYSQVFNSSDENEFGELIFDLFSRYLRVVHLSKDYRN